MPVVKEDVPIASVLGEPRTGMARHTFVGGNFFMQRMLNRFRNDLGVDGAAAGDGGRGEPDDRAPADRGAQRDHRQRRACGRAASRPSVSVENLGGHKLPTAYPSRRAWLHVTVRDRSGRAVFESGALDADRRDSRQRQRRRRRRASSRTTPRSRSPDQVQIYESVMAGPSGALTTGLLTAVRYVKDNRLLPRGFDKRTADKDIAVHGEAEAGRRLRRRRRSDPLLGGRRRRAGAVPGGSGAVVSADRAIAGR